MVSEGWTTGKNSPNSPIGAATDFNICARMRSLFITCGLSLQNYFGNFAISGIPTGWQIKSQ